MRYFSEGGVFFDVEARRGVLAYEPGEMNMLLTKGALKIYTIYVKVFRAHYSSFRGTNVRSIIMLERVTLTNAVVVVFLFVR